MSKEADEQQAKRLFSEYDSIRQQLLTLAREARPERGENAMPGHIIRMHSIQEELQQLGYMMRPMPDDELDSIKATNILRFASKTLTDSDLRLDADPDYDPAEHAAVMRIVLALVNFVFANQKDLHRNDKTLFFLRNMAY